MIAGKMHKYNKTIKTEKNRKFQDLEKERVKKPTLQSFIVKINTIKIVYWISKSVDHSFIKSNHVTLWYARSVPNRHEHITASNGCIF
jgi:hypothetical protein